MAEAQPHVLTVLPLHRCDIITRTVVVGDSDSIDPAFRDIRCPKGTLLCTFSTSARWFSRITGFFLSCTPCSPMVTAPTDPSDQPSDQGSREMRWEHWVERLGYRFVRRVIATPDRTKASRSRRGARHG